MPFEPTFEVCIRGGYNDFTTHLTQSQISSRLNDRVLCFVNGFYAAPENFDAEYLPPNSKIILTPPTACDGTTYRFEQGSLRSDWLTKSEIIKSTPRDSTLWEFNELNPNTYEWVRPIQLLNKNLEDGAFFRCLGSLVGGPTYPVELSNGAIVHWNKEQISAHTDFYNERIFNIKFSETDTRYITARRLNGHVSSSGRFLVNENLLTLHDLEQLDTVPASPLPLVQAAKISLGYGLTAFAHYLEVSQILKHAPGGLHAKIGDIVVRNGDLSTTVDNIDEILEWEFLKTDAEISLFSLGC